MYKISSFIFFLFLSILISAAQTITKSYITATNGTDGGNLFAISTEESEIETWVNFIKPQTPELNEMIVVDGRLWGTTEFGGPSEAGIIFSTNPDGSDFQVAHEFSGNDGRFPEGKFALIDNVLYGATSLGGEFNSGVVFAYDLTSNQLSKIYDFRLNDSIAASYGVSLIDGKLWGVSSSGGSNGNGAVYCINPDGSDFRRVVDFDVDNGTMPLFRPVEINGEVWGTTLFGGRIDDFTTGQGAIYAINPSTFDFRTIFSFDFNTSGGIPFGTLTESNGRIWGVAASSPNGAGSIYSILPNGTDFTIHHEFDFSQGSGSTPRGELVISNDRFWGVTNVGGNFGVGIIFSIDLLGSDFQKHYDFNVTDDGRQPLTGMTAFNSQLYGLAAGGGAFGNGTVYSIDNLGLNYQTVYDLNESGQLGASPAGKRATVGNVVYGITSFGGSEDFGVLYAYNIDEDNYELLYNFDCTSGVPNVAGVVDVNGKLWGTAITCGSDAKRLIYSINYDGSGYTMEHEFTDANGSSLTGLTVGNGSLWGLFTPGLDENSNSVDGTFFSFDPIDKEYSEVADFVSFGQPFVQNVTYANGRIWSVVPQGGSEFKGVIISVAESGGEVRLDHEFTSNEGSQTRSALIPNNGRLWGVAPDGGNNGRGTIYSITDTGTDFQVHHHFASDVTIAFDASLNSFNALTIGAGRVEDDRREFIYSIDNDGTNYRVLVEAVPAEGFGFGLSYLQQVDIEVPLSIANQEATNVHLFPNPVLNKLKVEGVQVGSISILDVRGHVIKEFSESEGIDLSDLKDGIYIVLIRDQRGQVVAYEKIIKN